MSDKLTISQLERLYLMVLHDHKLNAQEENLHRKALRNTFFRSTLLNFHQRLQEELAAAAAAAEQPPAPLRSQRKRKPVDEDQLQEPPFKRQSLWRSLSAP